MNKDFSKILEAFFEIKGEKKGLQNTEKLAEIYGNPHLAYEVVHITGTNGKGSTASFLAKILEEAGFKVGLYTSPHLENFSERIRVNSKVICEEYIQKFLEEIYKIKDIKPTFFEIATIMAYKYFKDEKIDVAVVEVGVGGKLDATNIVNPKLTIITNIALDHIEYLGNNVEAIAKEKSGIIKNNVPLIMGRMPMVAKKAIEEIANDKKCQKIAINKEYSFSINKDFSFNVLFNSRKFETLKISLPGDHLRENASLAVVASTYFKDVTIGHIKKGLLGNAILPARLELKKVKGKNIIFDVCHNVDGAMAFSATLKKYFSDYDRIFILASMLSNKQYEAMIKIFIELTSHCYLTKIRYKRTFDPNLLPDCLKDRLNIIEDQDKALEEIFSQMTNNDLLCLVGSFYFVGPLRSKLLGR